MGRSKLVRRVLIVLFFTVAIWALISTVFHRPLGREDLSGKIYGLCRLRELPRVSRKVLPALVHLRHGLAMQPYTSDFAKKNLTPRRKKSK